MVEDVFLRKTGNEAIVRCNRAAPHRLPSITSSALNPIWPCHVVAGLAVL
jgi:hypothetical protein